MRPEDASFFDPKAERGVLYRRLPHWGQAGCFAFVTFRLADSLPVALIDQLRDERTAIHSEYGLDLHLGGSELPGPLGRLSKRDESLLRWKLFSAWDSKLDSSVGKCLLRDFRLSRVVSDGLLKFDQDRYVMAAFVIMPNHVHVLAAFQDEDMIVRQGSQWRRFFAREINDQIGRKGHLWQEEQFDHLVRSEASFDRIRRYIIDNPAKAKLRTGDYRLFVSPHF